MVCILRGIAKSTLLILKWTLVALGAYLVIGLMFDEIRERRVGLGTGVLVMLATALIKGISIAWSDATRKSGTDQLERSHPTIQN
jgi:uncharacterized membrane protein YhiD involved in acid resistance